MYNILKTSTQLHSIWFTTIHKADDILNCYQLFIKQTIFETNLCKIVISRWGLESMRKYGERGLHAMKSVIFGYITLCCGTWSQQDIRFIRSDWWIMWWITTMKKWWNMTCPQGSVGGIHKFKIWLKVTIRYQS